MDLSWVQDGRRQEGKLGAIPADVAAVDVGADTAALYREHILKAKTVFVNGPMGVFEKAESELAHGQDGLYLHWRRRPHPLLERGGAACGQSFAARFQPATVKGEIGYGIE